MIRSGNASPPSETKIAEPSNDTRRTEELATATQYTYTRTRTRAREASVPQPGESTKIGGRDIHPSKLSEHLFALRAFGQELQSWHTWHKVGTLGPLFSGDTPKVGVKTIMAPSQPFMVSTRPEPALGVEVSYSSGCLSSPGSRRSIAAVRSRCDSPGQPWYVITYASTS